MKLLLLLFSLVILCNGEGYEYIAKFYGDVKTSAIEPMYYSSQFAFESDLHVKFLNFNSTDFYFEFRNPKAFVANGQIPISGYTKPHNKQPFPDDVEKYFTEPFLVRYSEDHTKLIHIYTKSNDEPVWSLNLKKAISTYFELNETIIEQIKTMNHSSSYSIDEPTIFGNCHTHITLNPYDDEVFVPILEKFFSPQECENYQEKYYSSMEKSACHNNRVDDKKVSNTITRKYYLGEIEDFELPHAITRVESFSEINYFPFWSNSKANIVYINQTMVMKEFKKIDFTEHVSDYHIKHENNYEFNDQTELDILKEINYHVTKEDYPTYKTNIDVCVNGIKNYAKQIDGYDVMYHILYKFPFFNFDELKQCHQILNKKDDKENLKVFYQILPNLGSKAATDFMLYIFENEKIRTSTSLQMIQSLPFSLRIHNENILKELKRITTDEYVVKPEVKSNAILAYGTLVYKTFKRNPQSEHVKEYVDYYYEHLNKATSYQEQLTWLNGLINIQHGDVWKYLLEIIRGDVILNTTMNDYLLLHALNGAEHHVYNHQTEFYDVIWPIIINDKKEIRLRVAALSLYMKGMHNAADFSRIFLFMEIVENSHLYNFFKTSVENFSKTRNHCNTVLETYAKEVLPIMKNYGTESSTEAFVYESYDEKFGFGTKISGGYVANVKSNQYNSFFVNIQSYLNEEVYDVYKFHITFNKLNEVFIDEILKMFIKSNAERKMPKIAKILSIYVEDDDLHLEITAEFNNRVVYVQNLFNYVELKNNNLGNILSDFMEYLSHTRHDDLVIQQALIMDRLIPTEMGIPVITSFRMPLITEITSEIGTTNTLQIKRHFDGYNGLRVFSPFTSTWHGVQREYAFSIYLPISFNTNILSFSPINIDLTFSIDTSSFKDSIYFEIKSLTHTISFIEHINDKGYVKKSSDSEKIYVVTQGDKRFMKHYKEMKSLENIGIDFNVDIDCENYRKEAKIIHQNYLTELWNTKYLSIGKVPFFESLNDFSTHIINYYLSPSSVQCKHAIKLSGSKSHPVDTYKFGLKVDIDGDTFWALSAPLNLESNFTLDIVKPNVDDSILWTGFIKTNSRINEIIKDIEFNAIGHVKNKPYKNLCFKLTNEYKNSYRKGLFKLFFSESYNKECTTDQVNLTITYNGRKSEEQEISEVDGFHIYDECYQPTEYYSFTTLPSYKCVMALSSLRDVEYKISYQNIPNNVKEFFMNLFTYFQTTYHTIPNYNVDTNIANEFVIRLIYPMTNSDTVNIDILFPDSNFIVESVYYPKNFFFKIPNTHFSNGFQLFKDNHYTGTCVFNADNEGTAVVENPVSDYKYYKLLSNYESNYALYSQFNKDHIDLKFNIKNYEGLIYVDKLGDDKKFYFTIGNQTYDKLTQFEYNINDPAKDSGNDNYDYDSSSEENVKKEKIKNEQNISKSDNKNSDNNKFTDELMLRIYQVQDNIVLVEPKSGIYIVYDGYSIKIEYFYKFTYMIDGLCHKKNF